MTRAGPGAGRRAHAYAYTLVTTAIVLVFALAEWATERYVSEHSRAASAAIEITIVLVAALVFRPVHHRVEAAVEAAFTKRKRHALAAIAKFRHELSSFNDAAQLLRRVVEAVEHHLEARACAVYLRRDAYRAEVSSFDTPASDVALDDPLAVRFRSRGEPARPQMLKSTALGTQAFAMTSAGELLGSLTVEHQHGEYDAEETQMLAGLASDLAGALFALDPALHMRKDRIRNNIPADLPPLIGRKRELGEVKAALAQSRLVTLTGAGGVGKTRIALQCASDMLAQYKHGVWFVNLAPITDGTLIPATILSAVTGGADGSNDATFLIQTLRARTALIIIDNCEQVIGDAAAIVAQITAHCAGITLLATSRETLHVHGEQVYLLGPLRTQAAAELFAQRAAAVSPGFDATECGDAVRTLCEHLDGIPLAIELAAARVRALTVTEILDRLHERFRLLTSGARTAMPRQQTLAATIEWSYDLLTQDEQSLFRHLGAFRGSFTLAAATAVFALEGRHEFYVLDMLTSLVDKSLVTATVALATRYRLLETIREFAVAKAVEHQAVAIAANHHAAYFAALAAQAYHEFDSRLPPGWLERLAPDLDNFRAGLEWTLEAGGDRRAGAQLAADCGPIFLRLQLLCEGLTWCEAARRAENLPCQTAARIEYVASMMHNNLGENRAALQCAETALRYYRECADERGLVRALSQVAQQYARSHRFEDAKAPAEEAIHRAHSLGEPRVLIAVLRRCAYALPVENIEQAREYFSEALDVARAAQDPEETCLVLQWWASREAAADSLERAMSLASQALSCSGAGSQLPLEIDCAAWALALGKYDEARPHALRALELAKQAEYPLARAVAIAYSAAFIADRDARSAATVFGYAKTRLAALEWTLERDDEMALESVSRIIESAMHDSEFDSLLRLGADLTEDRALSLLDAQLNTSPETSSYAGQRS
ncbi:MAG TPA: GAF domain-containing protein [Candidatus Baltobacteraceae bacterium]|nr:GAF domain-containing protein [Candidatus Baltobacteraceae bacterium]